MREFCQRFLRLQKEGTREALTNNTRRTNRTMAPIQEDIVKRLMSDPDFNKFLQLSVTTTIEKYVEKSVDKSLEKSAEKSAAKVEEHFNRLVSTRLTFYVQKSEMGDYAKKQEMVTIIDSRAKLAAEHKVYELLATQVGLQSIVERQRQELLDSSARLTVECQEKVEQEVSKTGKRVIDRYTKESLDSESGRSLVSALKRETSWGIGSYVAFGALAAAAGFAGSYIAK